MSADVLALSFPGSRLARERGRRLPRSDVGTLGACGTDQKPHVGTRHKGDMRHTLGSGKRQMTGRSARRQRSPSYPATQSP